MTCSLHLSEGVGRSDGAYEHDALLALLVRDSQRGEARQGDDHLRGKSITAITGLPPVGVGRAGDGVVPRALAPAASRRRLHPARVLQ